MSRVLLIYWLAQEERKKNLQAIIELVNERLQWLAMLDREANTARSHGAEEKFLQKLREMELLEKWQKILLDDFSLENLEKIRSELRTVSNEAREKLKRLTSQSVPNSESGKYEFKPELATNNTDEVSEVSDEERRKNLQIIIELVNERLQWLDMLTMKMNIARSNGAEKKMLKKLRNIESLENWQEALLDNFSLDNLEKVRSKLKIVSGEAQERLQRLVTQSPKECCEFCEGLAETSPGIISVHFAALTGLFLGIGFTFTMLRFYHGRELVFGRLEDW